LVIELVPKTEVLEQPQLQRDFRLSSPGIDRKGVFDVFVEQIRIVQKHGLSYPSFKGKISPTYH
jgi:hypothetical protein